MNVSEISGSNSNPNIWPFSVAVVVLNMVVMLALAVSNRLHIITKHGRTARAKEVLKFAALWGRKDGKVNTLGKVLYDDACVSPIWIYYSIGLTKLLGS